MIISSLTIVALALAAAPEPIEAFTLAPPSSPKVHHPGGRRRVFDSSPTSRLRLPAGFDIDDIERRAVAASEAWDFDVTPFLNADDAATVEERLGNRAYCSCVRVGGYTSSVRARFVLTNPELGLDEVAAEAEHCVVLCVLNVDLGNSDPLPNVLDSIGVDFDDLGDVIVDGGESAVYIVTAPGPAAKACVRLLPKELVGTGVTVSPLEPGETVPDGDVVDMEIQRLDKREQKRRK